MLWILSLIGLIMLFAYHRAALTLWMMTFVLWTALLSTYAGLSGFTLCFIAVFTLLIPLFLGCVPLRRYLISRPMLVLMHRFVPPMSETERIALESGTVGWEGEFFKAKINWNKLHSYPKLSLNTEEQAFMDGPVQELCHRIDDWQITHHDKDLPDRVWDFLKTHGFFGLEIPIEYGGKGFSAFLHAEVLVLVASRSLTVATTIAVPNSLGPAELILDYGTREQKEYYLPRLAAGEEIPCFALTGIDAGSDATAMTDTGIVCKSEYEGKIVLGIRLNANKRYITLAPVATVIGLAFKLYDPEGLLSETVSRGITCALVPSDTPGVDIGKRHYPMFVPFQNGPVQLRDVFIPMDFIIGGEAMIGQGWRMLVECLAVGRAISLPANALAGAKLAAATSGAYTRIRKQFGCTLSHFEGIQQCVAEVTCHTYMIDAARRLAIAAISEGEQPSVPSAIVKYHATESGRKAVQTAMDIHGGKAICLGPRNYLAQAYAGQPIGITVEGANILTRNLIIFGQGAVQCHPYLLKVLRATESSDKKAGLKVFDRAVFGWLAQLTTAKVRAFYLGLTGGRTSKVPDSRAKRYYQKVNRYTAAFSFIVDNCLILLNSQLKRREMLSARLGDVLSELYLITAILKYYRDEGEPIQLYPLIELSCQELIHRVELHLDGILQNFPLRCYGWVLRRVIFPLGRHARKPHDNLTKRVAKFMSHASDAREMIIAGIDDRTEGKNPLFHLQRTFNQVLHTEALERRVQHAFKKTALADLPWCDKVLHARSQEIINEHECEQLLFVENLRRNVLMVDAFDTL